MDTVAHDFTTFLSFLCFPKLFLQRNDIGASRAAAYLDDSEIALGVTLGDAISCELSVAVPDHSMVFVLGRDLADRTRCADVQAVEVLAVALQAGIARSDVPLPISLCVWSFMSLCEAIRAKSNQPSRINFTAIERVMGYPAGRATMSFEAYLRCIEPGFLLPLPDPDLALRMRSSASFAEWLGQLQMAFSLALEPDLAQG